jgi:hypothetical protein
MLCQPTQLALELAGGETVFECLEAVDGDDRDFVTIEREESVVLLYIDLFERVAVCATGGDHLLFGLFAEVAAGACVDANVGFSVHGAVGSLLLVGSS